MPTKMTRTESGRSILLLLLLLLFAWISYIAPQLTKLPDDFHYKAVIFSLDNLYDAEKQEFKGEQISDTEHYYEVLDKQNGILIIKNIFQVHKFNGEEIFVVERKYGIDPVTRKHVPGYGDRDREGYLFGPPGLKKGQNFTYWHINYNTPAYMQYQDEEIIDGLTVYRYSSHFQADQTFELERIQDLGKKGINLDVYLQLWIEPSTGWKIKYEDQATAYYYNLTTKERIEPWNTFHNTFDEISVLKQVEIAKTERIKIFLVCIMVPGLLSLAAIGLASYLAVSRKRRD